MTLSRSAKYKSEADFETDILPDLLDIWGRDIWHFDNSERRIKTRRGDPDHFFCFFGKFIAIEFKNGKTGKKPHEALQLYNLKNITTAGGVGCVCRTKKEVLDVFNYIYKKLS